MNEQRQSYLQGLRGQSKVTVLLQEPTSVRYDVSADKGFSRGPKDAPVTIVEFSDFQCPFCKSANTTVKQVLDKYPGKVRLVFRDYPIASLHPQAPKAHEAARCAGDQSKFWEYHDVLFERSPKAVAPGLEAVRAGSQAGHRRLRPSASTAESTRPGWTRTSRRARAWA